MLDAIRAKGDIADEDAFEAGIKAYAEQFVGSTLPGDTPAAEAQADAETSIATGTRHLPEEEIDRSADEAEG